ncbi:MAG: DUF4350 domain-containing protein [Planctomycetes bacterium]|nr:DUF4350 domain-containing protein [Planctomycetota bacterium]
MALTPTSGTSRGVRFWIGAQVLTVILLAGASAYLATWLAVRPGVAHQLDVSHARRNTLPDELVSIVDALPRPVKIETFLRPLEAPLAELSYDALGRVREFLFVLAKGREAQIEVVHWDLDDLATAKTRLAELDLREDNVIVVSSGDEKTLLKLYRDVVQVDPGNPDPRLYAEPRIVGFRPEAAFALALKRVTSGAAVRVLFSSGHGEREPVAPGENSIVELTRGLARDGFRVGAWDASRESDVPADCGVLAIVDPRQAFSAAECDAIRRHLARGGRLFVVPSASDASLASDTQLLGLLAESGLRIPLGKVAAPFRDPSGVERVGDGRCAAFAVGAESMDPRHPITESLWRSKRRISVASSRAFGNSRGGPQDATFAELLRAPRNAWIDRATPQGDYAWLPNPESEEVGPVPIAIGVAYAAPAGAATAPGESGAERAVTRIVAFGSADALTDPLFAQNGDFALNAFNWLAERDWRLGIPPRIDEPIRIDVARSPSLAWFNRLAIVGLPLICGLFGLVLFLRRRA